MGMLLWADRPLLLSPVTLSSWLYGGGGVPGGVSYLGDPALPSHRGDLSLLSDGDHDLATSSVCSRLQGLERVLVWLTGMGCEESGDVLTGEDISWLDRREEPLAAETFS